MTKWEDQNLEKDNIINNLRNGTVQLRKRFSAARLSTDRKDSTAAVRDDSTPSGFSVADAEFFVRFAQEADRNTEQLNACQKILSVNEGSKNGL